MRVTLPDGAEREVPAGSTFLDLAKSIGPGLAKAVVVAKLDQDLFDLQAEIPREGRVTFLKSDAPEAQATIRHSCEHVLATAVIRLFQGAQVTMGPQDHSRDFYYDFDIGRPFTTEDLERIEEEMKKLVSEDVKFVRRVVSKDEAQALFNKLGQRFKPEILTWIPDTQVTLYEDADFIDLCRGPHLPSAGRIGAFKLLGAAGSYWRGDAARDKLQRIRGVAFASKKELDAHLAQVELAKQRDHRKLSKELGLVGFSQLAPASPFFLPRGTIVYNAMVAYVRRLYARYGYQEVITPQIFSADLFKTSGHYDNYADNMYWVQPGRGGSVVPEAAGEVGAEWAVKPMNCPGHCAMYAMDLHSFRDLPWRVADFGRLHRAEGEAVHGLMRVRTFAQDDAHIFCTEDQMAEEMAAFVDLVDEVYTDFGFSDVKVRLATRPEKRMGAEELWDRAERDLAEVLKAKDRPYDLAPGEGAFYGPKLEFHIKDAIGRSWQLGTLQVDFNLPQRFQLEYVGADSRRHPPVMLHRAILGSLERFFGVYLEHTGGAFPTWLAPVQAVLLPVTDRALELSRVIAARLEAAGVRVDIDERNEKLGFKIREAQLQKVPYMLVVGDREVERQGASVRLLGGKDLGFQEIVQVVALITEDAKMPGHDRATRASVRNGSQERAGSARRAPAEG
ncbi:MAG: threonine--tRNA ligase [Deltaproteobacteria bacterium]|nr:threonine--tRNA ligase [Deltaproteobacteria bacterium]